MPSSLGLYIENNLIKYAKLTKNNDKIKVESFGVKFYEKADEAIKQIIEETYSYKTPISTNLSEEMYNYFDVFGGLKKKDIDGIVKTSFENYCYDNDLNKESYDSRHIYTDTPTNGEKIRVINISAKKTTIAKTKNQLSGYKVTSISPISIAISNLVKLKKGQTCLIVNMDEATSITKITEDTIKDVTTIPSGSKNILNRINNKENSYSKAYEICKNTTIYTSDANDLDMDENEFLPDIIPTLYDIITSIKEYIEQSIDSIDTIYLTGTLSVINNIDIYFQENFKGTKIEILKPYFVSTNSKINIKEYIEVNSALAVAMQSLSPKIAEIDFVKVGEGTKLLNALNEKVTLPKLNEIDIWDLYTSHKDKIVAFTSVLAIVLIAYIVSAVSINAILENKSREVQEKTKDTNNKIAQINNYNTKLNNRITKYKNIISNIEKNNDKELENRRYKNIIPNFMNSIMSIIPKEVQLTSMTNTNSTHIVLEAISSKYEQLAFFKTKIKSEGILNDVISDTGVASGGSIKVTIEGELP